MGAKQSQAQEIKNDGKGVNFSNIPASVQKVNISGLKRTHNDYIQWVPEQLFKVTSFEDILFECNNTREYLNRLGIFKEISVFIDVSKGNDAPPDGYDVTFEGVEFSRIFGEAGTEVSSNEGGIKLALTAPNLQGRGERLSLNGSRTTKSTTDIILTFLKPFHHTEFREYKPEMSISLFRHHASLPYMGCRTINCGLLGELTFSTPFNLQHSLQYEASCRDLFCTEKKAPLFVRQSCGPRMMSAVRLSTSYDVRDSPVFPTHGMYIKTTNEFSGLGGDISYISNTTHAEINIPLALNWSAQICSKMGALHSGKSGKNPPISSLFYLGGPMSLRGFQLAGVGPHDNGFATGVNAFWAVGLHLWMPLPFYTQLGPFAENWRTHLFCNFGNCNSFATHNMRLATGFGLACRLGQNARIELNWCFNISEQKDDKIGKGFQFGIGCDFL